MERIELHPAVTRVRRVLIATLGLALTSHALADAIPPVNPQPSKDNRWYGWQILVPDVAMLAIMASFAGSSVRAPVLGIGAASFFAAGPLVHVYGHDHGTQAIGSVVIRLLMTTVGGLIGFAAESKDASLACNDVGECIEAAADKSIGFYVGALLGGAGATAIDVSLLAWEPKQTDRTARATFTLSVAPRIEHNGGGLSLVGSF